MNIIKPIPRKLYLAFSGGMDSVFALHFLQRSKRDVTCIYVNHKTEFGNKCQAEIGKIIPCGTKLISLEIKRTPTSGESKEAVWRDERYNALDKLVDYMVVTAHNLNDVIETKLMGFARGKDWNIAYKRGNYLRPFLNVSRDEIEEYVHRHNLKWLEDPSNKDLSHPRNRIRHQVIPEMLKVNPGLYKAFRKNYEQ